MLCFSLSLLLSRLVVQSRCSNYIKIAADWATQKLIKIKLPVQWKNTKIIIIDKLRSHLLRLNSFKNCCPKKTKRTPHAHILLKIVCNGEFFSLKKKEKRKLAYRKFNGNFLPTKIYGLNMINELMTKSHKFFGS